MIGGNHILTFFQVHLLPTSLRLYQSMRIQLLKVTIIVQVQLRKKNTYVSMIQVMVPSQLINGVTLSMMETIQVVRNTIAHSSMQLVMMEYGITSQIMRQLFMQEMVQSMIMKKQTLVLIVLVIIIMFLLVKMVIMKLMVIKVVLKFL